MQKIVVTFALASEFAAWRRIACFEALNRRSCTYLMRSGDAEVYAVMLGIGMPAVPSELQKLFAASADLCIASGLAGSLKQEYRAGTIVVAKTVRTSGPDRAIQSDKSLVDIATQLGAASVDSFFTSCTVVNSRAEKFRLGAIADVVEMESFHVFRRAADYDIPVVALRAISDTAETNLPIDWNRTINGRGRIRWGSALYEIAKRPLEMPRLMRFGLDSARAARNLAHFLDRYVKLLISDPHPAVLGRAETK